MDPITAALQLAGQGLQFGGMFVERGNIQASKLPDYQDPRAAKNQTDMIVLVAVLLIVGFLLFKVFSK